MDYTGEQIPSGADLDDYTTPGKYYSPDGTTTGSLSNAPNISYGFTLIVIRTQNSTRRLQLAIDTLANVIYERGYGDTSWSSWCLCLTTANMQRGMESTSCSAGSVTTYTVTFPTAFKSAPYVFLTFQTSSTGAGMGNVSCGYDDVSTTGFTIRVFNNDSSTRSPNVRWLAVQF